MKKKSPSGPLEESFNNIREIIESGKALDIQNYANTRELYEAGCYTIIELAKQFRGEFFSVCEEIKKQNLPVTIAFRGSTNDEIEKQFKAPLAPEIKEFQPNQYSSGFNVQIASGQRSYVISVHFAFHDPRTEQPYRSKFGIAISLVAVDKDGKDKLRVFHLGILRTDSRFDLYKDFATIPKIYDTVELSWFMEKIKEWLIDKEVWRIAFER